MGTALSTFFWATPVCAQEIGRSKKVFRKLMNWAGTCFQRNMEWWVGKGLPVLHYKSKGILLSLRMLSCVSLLMITVQSSD